MKRNKTKNISKKNNLQENKTLNTTKQIEKSINKIQIENEKYQKQINYYKNELNHLKENYENFDSVIFYDYGTLTNHNEEWEDTPVSLIRQKDYTLVIPKSGKWFQPLKNNNKFFLPQEFKLNIELIEYNPTLRIILFNENGKTLETEIGYSNTLKGKGHLTLIYNKGNVKIKINEKIITKNTELGQGNIGIRFDMWSGKKLKFKELIIQSNIKYDNKSNIGFCPICGNLSEFIPEGNSEFCPSCMSLERHRFVYLLFKKQFNEILNHKRIKLLHFAPEKCMYDFFSRKKNIDYYPVDLNSENYGVTMRGNENMESISYANNTFNIIYHCHVLEHVHNDIAAMKELYRVLKPNGYCIFLVPINFSLKETLEKEEYNTPELREKYYEQHDHMRYYAMDIVNKLKSVGFNVNPIFSEELFDFENEMKIYKINHDVAFICKK